MHKNKLFIASACFLAIGLFIQKNTDFRHWIIQFVPAGYSTTNAFGQSSGNLRLEKMAKTFFYIDTAYVDPKRVSQQKMFEKALEELSANIPEVQAIFPQSNKADLVVNKTRKSFDTRVKHFHALHKSISRALMFIKENKTSTISDSSLEAVALNACLSTLDPHSLYLSKEVYQEMLVGTSGEFGGLGIVIGLRDKKLTIISPIEGSPAYKVGLQSGDHISKIGSESTQNMALNEAVKRMRGPKGTKVKISVSRPSWDKEKDFSLKRDTIAIVSVESDLLPNDIAYIRVKNFQQDTAQSMNKHIKKLHKKAPNFNGLVLDLRGNPGGIFDQAVNISDTFLNKGTIVSTVGLNNTVNQKETAKSRGTEPNYPVIILVDEGSASASEIVAGALKQRALILGEKTFGKGSVQSLFDLPDSSALKLTIAQYLTPGEVSIQGVGIMPHVALHSVFLSEKVTNIYPSQKKYGESSLDGHLINPNSLEKQKKNTVKALYNVNYLETLDKDGFLASRQTLGDNKSKRLEKILKDYQVGMARSIISKSQSGHLSDLLSAAKVISAQANTEQNQKIVSTLQKSNVDWTASTSSCNKKPIITAYLKDTNNTVVAGEKVKLHVSLKNTSTCTYSRAWVETESKQYFFDAQEILFGKILPGQEVKKSIDVEIPKAMFTGLSNVALAFNLDDKKNKHTQSMFVKIMGQTESPVFAYELSIKDKNNNQKLERSETAKIKVKLKNLGRKNSNESAITISAAENSDIKIKQGHASVRSLNKKQSQTVHLEIQAKKSFDESRLKFNITTQDVNHTVYRNDRINLDAKKLTKGKTQYIPPSIKLNNETSFHKERKGKFAMIEGIIEDDQHIKDYFVLVNSKKVHYHKFDTKNAKQKFSTSIPLEPGNNYLSIVTRDNQDLSTVKKVLLQRQEEL